MIIIMISIIIIIVNHIHLVTLSPKPAQTPTPSSSNLTITASAAISHSSIFEMFKIFTLNMQNILLKRLQSHHYCLCHYCSCNGNVIHSSLLWMCMTMPYLLQKFSHCQLWSEKLSRLANNFYNLWSQGSQEISTLFKPFQPHNLGPYCYPSTLYSFVHLWNFCN